MVPHSIHIIKRPHYWSIGPQLNLFGVLYLYVEIILNCTQLVFYYHFSRSKPILIHSLLVSSTTLHSACDCVFNFLVGCFIFSVVSEASVELGTLFKFEIDTPGIVKVTCIM